MRSINLLFANIINQVVNRKELKQNYAIQLEDIMFGKKETNLHTDIDLDGEIFGYSRGMIRNTGRKMADKKSLDKIAAIFHEKYVSDEEQKDIPISANYGTNRLVLDIPLRIRTHHTFDIYSAFEKAIENKIDFRTFFEWYRDQEDFENETKIETGDLSYKDNALLAVRRAILAMLDDCSNLRVVRKPRLEMKIDKQNMSLNVSQMSDGEKCNLALFGDLARRLTLLEQFMGTRSMNVKMQQFIDSIYRDIEQREYERAEDKINELADITSENHGDVIMARMELKRRMHDRRKRSCGNQISWSKEGWI